MNVGAGLAMVWYGGGSEVSCRFVSGVQSDIVTSCVVGGFGGLI